MIFILFGWFDRFIHPEITAGEIRRQRTDRQSYFYVDDRISAATNASRFPGLSRIRN
jgi:hypothetical protein